MDKIRIESDLFQKASDIIGQSISQHHIEKDFTMCSNNLAIWDTCMQDTKQTAGGQPYLYALFIIYYKKLQNMCVRYQKQIGSYCCGIDIEFLNFGGK